MKPREIAALRRKLRALGVPAPCIRNHIDRTISAKAAREKRHAEFVADKAKPFRLERAYVIKNPKPARSSTCVVCGSTARMGRKTCSPECLRIVFTTRRCSR